MELPPPQSPPPGPGAGTRLLAGVLGIVVIASAVVLGFAVFFALMLAGFIAWLAYSIRRWWQQRGVQDPDGSGRGDTLEGHYRVLDRNRDWQEPGDGHE